MSMKLECRYDQELKALVLVRNESVLSVPSLLPIDGNTYGFNTLGLTQQDFNRTEEDTLGGSDNGIQVSVDLACRTIKASAQMDTSKPPVLTLSTGEFAVDDSFGSLTLAQQLAVVKQTIEIASRKVTYNSLATVLGQYNLAGYIESLIVSHYDRIDFSTPKSESITASDNSLVVNCIEDDSLASIEFKAENEVVTIWAERSTKTEATIAIDGPPIHLSQLGISVDDVLCYLPIPQFLQEGIYFLELGNTAVVTINNLGLVHAYSYEQLLHPATQFIVNEDCTITQIGGKPKIPRETLGLIVYGLLASFNKASNTSLITALEMYGLDPYFESVKRTVEWGR